MNVFLVVWATLKQKHFDCQEEEAPLFSTYLLLYFLRLQKIFPVTKFFSQNPDSKTAVSYVFSTFGFVVHGLMSNVID